jgi:hypothetical protein
MFGQLRTRKASGRDRNCPGADRFAAGDIVRSVPDHIDLRGREIDRVFLPGARSCKAPELIAVVVIVGKCAELEKIPKAEMRQLQFRPALQVTGKKTQHILRPRLEPEQQFVHAREDCAFALGKLARQKFDIEIEEGRGRLLIHSDLLFAENLMNDSGISLARDLDPVQIV